MLRVICCAAEGFFLRTLDGTIADGYIADSGICCDYATSVGSTMSLDRLKRYFYTLLKALLCSQTSFKNEHKHQILVTSVLITNILSSDSSFQTVSYFLLKSSSASTEC